MPVTGDSILACPNVNDSGINTQGGEPSVTIPVAQYLLGSRVQMWSGAIGGQSLASMVSLHTTQVLPYISTTPGVLNACLFNGGFNDQVSGTSLAALVNLFTTYVADLRADGCTKVIYWGPEASNIWQIYSEGGVAMYYGWVAWLEANWSTYVDAFIDWSNDPILGNLVNDGGYQSYGNITWRLDNTHPTLNMAAYAAQGPVDGGSGVHQAGLIPVLQAVLSL